MQQLSIENEIYGNVELIVNLLNINIDDKENLKKIFDIISIEVSKLKHSLDSLPISNSTTTNEIKYIRIKNAYARNENQCL
jgi:hypothetical protein